MSWESVNLADVDLTIAPLPEAKYVFRLLGAQYDEKTPGRIVAKAAVTDESEWQGRRQRFTYPDPELFDWAPRALKRLEVALGVDAMPDEDPVTYLNRAAGDAVTFSADVTHRAYTPEGATEEVISSELGCCSHR